MNSQKQEILAYLERIKSRPQFYVPEFELVSLSILVDGFRLGCFAALGDKVRSDYTEVFCDVVKERGWEMDTLHFLDQMSDSGLSPEHVFQEIMEIEIEVWKRLIW